MDSRLITLLANSASITKNTPDKKVLMQLWLRSQLFGQATDWTSLNQRPQGLKTITADEALNIELYAIANKLGLPTDGRALFNRVQASVGIPSPQEANIPELIQNAWFKYIGAY